MNRFLDVYWVIYFIGYLAAFAALLSLRWHGVLQGPDRVHLLAAVFGVAAGAASVFAILVEGGVRIVLLIPATIRRLLEQGRKEAREEMQERRREAYRRFGVEMNGVRVLPDTPEVERFLEGNSQE